MYESFPNDTSVHNKPSGLSFHLEDAMRIIIILRQPVPVLGLGKFEKDLQLLIECVKG